MEIKIENVTNFLKALSWSKIFQVIAFLSILAIFYAGWENRVIIYNTIKVGPRYESSGPLLLDLSKETTDYVDVTVGKSKELIAGVQILSVDFRKNTRYTSYFAISDEVLRISYKNFVDNKVAPTPLFTDNESNNQRVINLINGEFVCRPLGDTMAGVLFKGSDKSVNTMCSISIPPYYGRFSGYMNIFLKRAPTEADIIFVRQVGRDVSLRIYEYDIDKSSRYQIK